MPATLRDHVHELNKKVRDANGRRVKPLEKITSQLLGRSGTKNAPEQVISKANIADVLEELWQQGPVFQSNIKLWDANWWKEMIGKTHAEMMSSLILGDLERLTACFRPSTFDVSIAEIKALHRRVYEHNQQVFEWYCRSATMSSQERDDNPEPEDPQLEMDVKAMEAKFLGDPSLLNVAFLCRDYVWGHIEQVWKNSFGRQDIDSLCEVVDGFMSNDPDKEEPYQHVYLGSIQSVGDPEALGSIPRPANYTLHTDEEIDLAVHNSQKRLQYAMGLLVARRGWIGWPSPSAIEALNTRLTQASPALDEIFRQVNPAIDVIRVSSHVIIDSSSLFVDWIHCNAFFVEGYERNMNDTVKTIPRWDSHNVAIIKPIARDAFQHLTLSWG